MNIGKSGIHAGLTGRLSIALECWPTSCIYLGCRVGQFGKRATVYVFVCVSDAMGLNYGAIRLVDVGRVVTGSVNTINNINGINRFIII